ncbi:MAG: MBL fold metallo-hydrolase, partial [Erysipelothrix sp.]|nr:MBL fold metallo-hydrolase [Erysipelothrix sp.]
WGMCVYFAYYPLHDLVLYLNVGQADATLIKLAQGQGSMMFDVGRAQNVPLILNTLKALGIQHLDGIVISHDDSDHSGGLEDLTISMPKTIIHTEKKDIVFKRLYFQAFNQDYIGIDNNDDSVIGLVHLGRLKFLFMGDAGIMAEQHLIKSYPHLQVDVLKLGHHGSKTSTSSTFLASLQPTFGIISADRQVYGHPAPEVLRNLAQYQVTVLDTQVHGDLAFIRLFNQYFVITSAGYFGIIR